MFIFRTVSISFAGAKINLSINDELHCAHYDLGYVDNKLCVLFIGGKTKTSLILFVFKVLLAR